MKLKTDKYEAEGALAAHDGKTREDCPYPDQNTDEWNFWVYGNENEQGRMLRSFMQDEGTPQLWMSTAPLNAYTKQLLKEYSDKCQDADKRMRKERGWE